MQAFIAGARQRLAVVGQQKPLWGCVVLTALTWALLRMRLPTVDGVASDIFIRLSGVVLQLIGAVTVLKDLTKTASDFGEGPSLRKFGDYIKAIFFGPPPINGSVTINLQTGNCTSTGSLATIHQGIPSNEVRIARLEQAVKSLQGELEKVNATVETNKQEFVHDLKVRTAELRQTIADLNKQLKNSLVGSFSMLSFGVYSLAIGIVLTSIPVELATLVRLGQLPRFG